MPASVAGRAPVGMKLGRSGRRKISKCRKQQGRSRHACRFHPGPLPGAHTTPRLPLTTKVRSTPEERLSSREHRMVGVFALMRS